MLKYEGEAKGIMLGPFKFTNNGVVYFGQWQVQTHLFRTSILTEKDSYISQMVLYFREAFLRGNQWGKVDWSAWTVTITKVQFLVTLHLELVFQRINLWGTKESSKIIYRTDREFKHRLTEKVDLWGCSLRGRRWMELWFGERMVSIDMRDSLWIICFKGRGFLNRLEECTMVSSGMVKNMDVENTNG